MKEANKQALIVGYYLSKYDTKGYRDLGYKNFAEAVREISKKLAVNPNTLKNMRDEFDPYHRNNRRGWYQKELTVSRREVMESFRNTDENSMREIIFEIVENQKFRESAWSDKLLSLNQLSNTATAFEEDFSRGITGKKAEEYFINHFAEYKDSFPGTLTDKRHAGCGYDFEIESGNKKYFFEIKGLSSESGGILFTNKEWYVARMKKAAYILVLIVDLKKGGKVIFLPNPTSLFLAKKNISVVPRVEWHISEIDVERVKADL